VRGGPIGRRRRGIDETLERRARVSQSPLIVEASSIAKGDLIRVGWLLLRECLG
jgi:hypothetical protein